MNIVDIHADDFGYSLSTSKDILNCIKEGNLDSISVMGNMSAFEESMQMLYEAIPELPFLPKMSIHINIPEGSFVHEEFPMSWEKLFLKSYSFEKNQIKKLLKDEIGNQIKTAQNAIEKCWDIAKKSGIKTFQNGIRLDSHIHTHLIPVVWEAMIEVIEEEKLNVEYIRNPKEPIGPFLARFDLWPSYSLINVIKNRILMFYSGKVDRYCDAHGMKKMYMWGLMMSGKMDAKRIEAIYPDMKKECQRKDRTLEMLFHPGRCKEEEYLTEMGKKYFDTFNASSNRDVERESLSKVRIIID